MPDLLTVTPELRDFYDPDDFSEAEVEAALKQAYDDTAIERQWHREAGLRPFANDTDIAVAHRSGLNRLETVDMTGRYGFLPIFWLQNYPESGYSPPYLRPAAHHILQYTSQQWAVEEGRDDAGQWMLPVTSLIRATRYQTGLRSGNTRKLAILPEDDEHSSHEYGIAFDIDNRGLYRLADDGKITAVHSQNEHDYWGKLSCSQEVLRGVLDDLVEREYVNVVPELPGTHQWCLHICVNPNVPVADVLFGLRLQPIAAS